MEKWKGTTWIRYAELPLQALSLDDRHPSVKVSCGWSTNTFNNQISFPCGNPISFQSPFLEVCIASLIKHHVTHSTEAESRPHQVKKSIPSLLSNLQPLSSLSDEILQIQLFLSFGKTALSWSEHCILCIQLVMPVYMDLLWRCTTY